MAKETPLLNNFNAGEISPTIDVRSDLQKYYSGCKRLENFVPQVEGGVQRMPGTYFISQVRSPVASSSISPSSSVSPSASISPSVTTSASSASASVSPSAATGNWTDEVNSATTADQVIPFNSTGGAVFDVSISANSTNYILIDPKGFSVAWAGDIIYVRIEDVNTILGGTFNFRVMELDATNNFLYAWNVGPGTAGMYNVYLKNFTQNKYDEGVKFLLRAIEIGGTATSLNVKWWS